MKKRTKLIAGLSMLTLFIVGQVSYAAETNQNTTPMMNGMSNMMNMMDNPGMMKMMNAMNTPEGQEMMKNCSNFMETNDGNNPAN
ncbi:hypothetical protein [Brevibacillus choshinensis]|uniref:hypothetical protein n=1 Tax=Brevibacillus choshinensis TaxID=54911 RepID=UPI002E1DB3DE|nr:hypothetical protein [Brevibacillus choshinensis]